MIQGYCESSLSTSEVFQGLSEMANSNIKEKAISLIKTAKRLNNEDIQGTYIQLKQYSNTLTRAALSAYDDGSIVLLYNNVPSLSITQALPFITFKTQNGYITYVFMDKYVSYNRDGLIHIQVPILHDLLIGAMIANKLKTNYGKLQSSQYLEQVLMDCYCRLFMRILNREYSIAAEKQINETCQFYINKFFLNHIFGTLESPENVDIISSKQLKVITELDLEQFKIAYDEKNPSKLSELLELLKTVSPRMKTLDLGTFLSSWINYYYMPSMLATDTMEYLIFMILTLLNGNNIISVGASDIVKETKNIKSLREELLKLTAD